MDQKDLLRKIVRETGLSETTARRRIKRWQKGEISDKDLFKKSRKKKTIIKVKKRKAGIVVYGEIQKFQKDGLEFAPRELSVLLGISEEAARHRLYRWVDGKISIAELLQKKLKKAKVYVRDGHCYTFRDLSERLGLSKAQAHSRLAKWARGEISTEELFAERAEKYVRSCKKPPAQAPETRPSTLKLRIKKIRKNRMTRKEKAEIQELDSLLKMPTATKAERHYKLVS